MKHMLNGSTISIKFIFIFYLIIALVIVSIIVIFNFPLFWNIIVHGTIAGPCVWLGDYESRGLGSIDDLIYDKELQCYLKPE